MFEMIGGSNKLRENYLQLLSLGKPPTMAIRIFITARIRSMAKVMFSVCLSKGGPPSPRSGEGPPVPGLVRGPLSSRSGEEGPPSPRSGEGPPSPRSREGPL